MKGTSVRTGTTPTPHGRMLRVVTAMTAGALLLPLSVASAATGGGDTDGDQLEVQRAQSVLRQVNDPGDDVMIQAGVAANPDAPGRAVVTSMEGEEEVRGVGLRY